jgi:putative ABC transport system permease protein
MWKLAWRNLWRNRTRTAIITSALSLSLWLLLVQLGVNDNLHHKMELSAVKTAGGSVLAHADGYWERQTSDAVIADPAPLIEAAHAVPQAVAVIQRVYISGLLTSPRGSAGVRLTGIDPTAEALLQDLAPYISEGAFIPAPSPDAPPPKTKPLVLGAGVVKDLEIKLGDRVVLTATQPSGEVTHALFHLSGVLKTGVDALDAASAYTSLPAAREVLGSPTALTQVALVLGDDRDRDAAKAAWLTALGDRARGLEVLTWSEAMPGMVGFIEIDDAFMYIYSIVVFVIVGFGIANTFMMSVMERVRELGLLGALGLSPRRVFGLVLSETTLLSALSIAIGLTLGLLSHLYLSHAGIDLRDLYDMDMQVGNVSMMDTIISSTLRWGRWGAACGFVSLMVLLSALYPAWRASQQDPAQAMRTYE